MADTSSNRSAQVRPIKSVRRNRVVKSSRQSFEVAADLEAHVSWVDVPGHRAMEIRYFIPSTGTYGRGITLPADCIRPLRRALMELLREEQ